MESKITKKMVQTLGKIYYSKEVQEKEKQKLDTYLLDNKKVAQFEKLHKLLRELVKNTDATLDVKIKKDLPCSITVSFTDDVIFTKENNNEDYLLADLTEILTYCDAININYYGQLSIDFFVEKVYKAPNCN